MKIKSFFKKYIPTPALVALCLFLVSGIIYLIAIKSAPFADFINRTVGTAVRALLATASAWMPFSFFELMIILALPLCVILVILLVKLNPTKEKRVRSVISFLSLISLVLSSYVFTLGVGYRTTPLSESIGIEDVGNIDKSELYNVTERVLGEVNSLAPTLDCKNGESVMPYTLGELSSHLCSDFESLADVYPVISTFKGRVKPVLFSTVMSDAGITGIYSFFTGEANVNIEYPHYNLPFTAAHEMAHQRGIARENEANFVAFLVCIGSTDGYIRYSGYLSMLEYLLGALYSADKELYREIYSRIDARAIDDMRASNAVTLAHKDSFLNKLNDKLNDNYLKANGTAGVVTYGYVVRLTVGYYRQNP